jgi:hypothetical protein
VGEKVPEADEGVLVLAMQPTIFMNGRGKLMKILSSARERPPLKNAGEKALAETQPTRFHM